MNPAFEAWIEGQYRHSARCLPAAISCGITVERPGFGLSVRAAPGSVVASPVPGAYDPEPDYFFHWYRDAAVVIDALRVLHLDDPDADLPPRLFGEFLQFGLRTLALDGGALVAQPGWRGRVQPQFTQYLRTDAELARARGADIRGETRLNADGTLDITNWPRPQHDGIATRALALRRWLRQAQLTPALAAAARELLAGDLDYTRAHWREPCHDIWEEERGLHYYTLLAAAAALADSDAPGETPSDAAAEILRRLDDYWNPRLGCYRSRMLPDGGASIRDPDISVILAAVHCDLPGARHCVADPRLHATLASLEKVFMRAFAINADLPEGHAPALGRYERDVYYGGGAWYVSTLGAAEFCYRAAHRCADARAWILRGDAFLATARRFTPASGDLSEQFDRDTGEPRSARHLTWSYAAFITCVAVRRTVVAES